ncbi:gas vesicle protein [Flavobacterium sp. PL11]|jgi:gas vesicle protein|uniref:YtxH domain-containing protein n=1 Tax=Flavobacterium sp. PL11 TaxID=3071717 RepID=UPI002DFF9D10|nr:gas vesicle protein [Flavobacterium sp. PL11]
MKADKIILGVLGGVAVGALLGVLYAPEKGDKTRRKLMDKSNDYADELKDKLDVLLGSISDKYEKIWKEGESLVSEGKSKYQDVKNDAENFMDEGKAKVENAKSDFRNS